MFTDYETLMSDDQAITATAASTNYIDIGADADIGIGQPVNILVQVTEAFTNLTNLAIAIQTDDNSSFSSATTIYTETIVLANLTAGAKINMRVFPPANERYVRMYYTVTGSAPNAGKITAGAVVDHQDEASYPDAL